MVAIACRWPGGTNLVLKRNGMDPIVVHLNGPTGSPMETLPGGGNPLRSRTAALGMHKRILDTVERLKGSREHHHTHMEYVVNTVQDAFWEAWYQQNKQYDLVQHKIVFELPQPEPMMIAAKTPEPDETAKVKGK